MVANSPEVAVKTARPLDPKRPVHLVLRSSRAKGPWSLLHPKNERRVRRVLDVTAAKYGVRVYRFANVGNHLHLLIMARSRRIFRIPSRVLRTNRPSSGWLRTRIKGRFVRRTREGIPENPVSTEP